MLCSAREGPAITAFTPGAGRPIEWAVPYLIDGNNLIFALIEVGPEVDRVGLCLLLAPLVEAGRRVRVVFDGPPPERPGSQQIADTGVAVSFCPGSSADEEIIDRLNADSAPRLLTVVSSDRRIRKAAARRKCKSVRSEDFAKGLSQMLRLAGQPRPTDKAEPPEKRKGLTPEQTRSWLDEFGLDG